MRLNIKNNELLLGILFLLSLTGYSQTNTYSDVESPLYWTNEDNWSLGHLPLASEDVIITANCTIQLVVNAVAKSVVVQDGANLTVEGTLTIEIYLEPDEVYNPVTGKIWMDRNLGAIQVATSSDDAASFGDLYQWGRLADGHEKRTSSTTTVLSSSDDPGHSDFILVSADPIDWRDPQNNNLWQGENGVNNPCPDGYRIPTIEEWNAERATWDSPGTAGAFGSVLKLPQAGTRRYTDGDISPGFGAYWSSTTVAEKTSYLFFYTGFDNVSDGGWRAQGNSVRCIKDE